VKVAGADEKVEWDADSAAQPRTEFAKLTLTGRLTDDDAPVVAAYEVIPQGVTYFIDSGTNGVASPEYTAVKTAVPSLRNDKVDQVSTAESQWGYVADGMVTKSTTDINDKYSTGLYQNTTALTYRLPLDAGTYTLTGGFTEWWNLSRSMYQTVSVDGTQLAKGSIPLSGTNTPLSEDLTFTLSAPAAVDYIVTNEGAGSEKPVISWLAVTDVTLPGAPTGVKAAATGDTSVGVSWNASNPTGQGFTGYRVYDGDATEPVCTTSTTSCSITGLSIGSTHTYRVTGVNALGEGDPSAPTAPVVLPEVPSNDGATAAPGVGVLTSNDGWDTGLKDGDFQITMDMWWGSNGSLFKLFQDGKLITSVRLAMATPAAQKAVVDIAGLKNGTYRFTGQLVNSKGVTATQPLTVTVTDASPGKAVLSSDNWDGDGTYTVTANMWWGTNATSYRFLENGIAIASGTLTAKTPAAQQATLTVVGKAKGTYSYTVEFTNAAGTTVSAPITVAVTNVGGAR
jgi:hypothetical protein